MEKAMKQAENYDRLLDVPEIKGGRPPFLMVADVRHSIALYTVIAYPMMMMAFSVNQLQ